MSRTHPFAGGISGNRYVFGGLETAVAVAALAISTVGVSGSVEAEPYTSPSCGMIGAYRTITPPAAVSEGGAGASTVTLSAAGVSSTTAQDLTASWAGMISRHRGEITQATNSQYSFVLSAILGGSVNPFTQIAFTLPLAAVLAGSEVPLLTRPTRGAATLTISAAARMGATGASSLSISAFGAGVGIGSPAILGAGESLLIVSAAGEGLATWPMSPQALVTLSAQAAGESSSETSGDGTLTLSSVAIGYQDGAGAGEAGITFSASSNSGQVIEAEGEAFIFILSTGVPGGRIGYGILTLATDGTSLTHTPHLSTLTRETI